MAPDRRSESEQQVTREVNVALEALADAMVKIFRSFRRRQERTGAEGSTGHVGGEASEAATRPQSRLDRGALIRDGLRLAVMGCGWLMLPIALSARQCPSRPQIWGGDPDDLSGARRYLRL